MKDTLISIIKKIPAARIAVVGDVALDEFISGPVTRASPEAPVVIVNKKKTETMLGCAGNVVANLRALDAKVFFITVLGKDRTGDEVKTLLKDSKVDFCGVEESDRITPRKTRIIGEKQHVVRIDDELIKPISSDIEKLLLQKLASIINKIDIIIISDYEKGLLTESFVNKIKSVAKQNSKRIIVDLKPKSAASYKGVYLIKPNLAHAKEMLGNEMLGKEILRTKTDASVEEIGKKLTQKFDSNFIITLGPDGMMVFEKGKTPYSMPTEARKVYDVVGAGDTTNAMLAVSLAAGANLSEASRIANIGAGIVVGKPGTATVSISELLEKVSFEVKKIKAIKELRPILQDEKQRNKSIVWTNGCFDILHPGHIRFLQNAKKLGDILIVGINADNSLYVKNKNRKLVNTETDRAEVIAALEFVDYVLIFNESDPSKVITALRPDVYAKGANWKDKKMPEEAIIRSYGGRIEFVPLDQNYSTENIFSRIRKTK